jgi:transposase
MYTLDTIIEVRRLHFEERMSVTDISKKIGLSRTTIYKFLDMDDFNISEVKDSKGMTVVNLKDLRKSPEAGHVPEEAENIRDPIDDAASAASTAEEADGCGEPGKDASETGKKTKGSSKLDPYKQFIIERLLSDKKENRKQRHTNKKLFDSIKKLGYDGGHTIFDDYMRQIRAELQVDSKKTRAEGYLPLYHYPGEAQADFGKSRFEEDGLSYNGSFFVLSFPHSNAGYLQQQFGENLECLLESLKAIFEYLNGVPPEIWFDNASAIVIKILSGDDRNLTERFIRFKEHYHFKAVFMNPESGWEKGNTERKVSYLRHNILVPVPMFSSLKSYNNEVFIDCEELIQKDMHYRLKVPVRNLFAEDKEKLLPLPSSAFDTADYKVVHTDKWGLFKLHKGKHIYSSAPNFADTDLLLRITAAHVEVRKTDNSHIVTHPRLYGGDNDHMERIDYVPYLKYIARKPRSFSNIPIREMMPTDLVSYLDSLPNGERGRISPNWLYRPWKRGWRGC